jgi:hypothetical protein
MQWQHFLNGIGHTSSSPGSLSVLSGLFRVFTKIRADIRNFVFIAGVIEPGDKLLLVSLIPVIN